MGCALTPSHALGCQPNLLRDVVCNGGKVITMGNALLDRILGGGIRVSMIWEFVGERQVVVHVAPHFLLHRQHNSWSSFFFTVAGKTQLALQLSLLVQLPITQGGLDGSAAYLTTSGSLPTPHLVQLLHSHLQCKADGL